MPPPPPEVFLDAVLSAVRANQHYVPPLGKGSLYIRPLLIGSGSILGLGPAPSYSFIVYAAAVGSYFKVVSQSCCYCPIQSAEPLLIVQTSLSLPGMSEDLAATLLISTQLRVWRFAPAERTAHADRPDR
jgi:hypothetical protein